MDYGSFILGAWMHLRGPCLISHRCLCTFWVPICSPAPTRAGRAGPGWRQAPAEEEPIYFAFHSRSLPRAQRNPPRKERSEGRINLLNNKNPAHLLMKCNDLETCKMDRAVARSHSP